jgi:DNA recombination protein RmuC
MSYLSLLIGIVVGGVIGFLVAKLLKGTDSTAPISTGDGADIRGLQQERTTLTEERNALDKSNGIFQGKLQSAQDENVQLNMQLQSERDKNERMIANNSEWKAKYAALQEKLEDQKKELDEMQQKFTTEFENIANKILEQKSEKFTEKNKQNIEGILEPLKERIKTFEEKVDKSYSEENKERISLKSEIRHLMDLNKQLSEDANNLATALKGENKTQGDWGEMQLEMILERAGLQKGLHYTTQTTFRDEEGQMLRPDCIINLPDSKNLIVDSKVSLTAYSAFFGAETEEDRALHLKAHLASIRNHVRELGEKNYQNLYEINSPDYVLMFIPIESAFTLAFQHDDELFMSALKKNIVIVTTSTLLATMRTVSFIWKQEDQKRNVLEIARQGGDLYDKFVAFVNDLSTVGKRMEMAKKSYDDAMSKLIDGKGNLVGRTEKIRKLGLKTSKQMPQEIVDRANEENSVLLSDEATNEPVENTDPLLPDA